MPKFSQGNLMDRIGKDELVLFTGNSYVNSAGELVMGRGAALQFKKQYPDLPKNLGDLLKSNDADRLTYGVLISSIVDSGTEIGAFQVKVYWAEPASLYVIELSVKALCALSRKYNSIALNYPGVGCGRLPPERVAPVLRPLPSNVCIYSYEGHGC